MLPWSEFECRERWSRYSSAWMGLAKLWAAGRSSSEETYQLTNEHQGYIFPLWLCTVAGSGCGATLRKYVSSAWKLEKIWPTMHQKMKITQPSASCCQSAICCFYLRIWTDFKLNNLVRWLGFFVNKFKIVSWNLNYGILGSWYWLQESYAITYHHGVAAMAQTALGVFLFIPSFFFLKKNNLVG